MDSKPIPGLDSEAPFVALPGAATAPRGRRTLRASAELVPIVALVAAMAIVGRFAPERVYPAPLLLLSLNVALVTLVSFLVLYLALRGFLARGQPGLLLFACGAEIWGGGGLLAPLVGWTDPNLAVTVHNMCALLAAACHLGAALASRRPALRVRDTDRAAAAALGAGLVATAAVAAAALSRAMPVFFVQGVGGTLVRQLVGGAAVAAFALAAVVLALGRGPLTPFVRLYAMGLALVAAGMAGGLVQASVGDLLGWTARATRYLGGVYMLAAALASMRGLRGWELSLEAGLEEARAELRAREAQYRAFFEHLGEAVALYEPVRDAAGEPSDWIVRDANERYTSAFGIDRHQIVGRRISEALGPERLAQWSSKWREVLATGRTIEYERDFRDRTWLVTCFRPEPDLVAATGLDVTDRRRAERALRDSERLYRAIGESIDFGVWVCAPDGRNVYASESFLELVGLTQQQCSDFGWGDVLHPDDAERTITAWKECVRSGGSWDIEHRFRGTDGRWHPILARGVPVRNEAGEIVCWAGINLDIARLKEAEERLRQSDERKSEFLAVLSHELRNPLAPIQNAAHLLAIAPPDGPQAERAREVIERQVGHLARLVDDLLDTTRVTRGKVTLARRRMDLRAAVVRTCEDHRPIFSERGITLRVETAEPVGVDADPTRIAQVIGNLLQNASRFTPPGGTVTVALAARDGRAELRVEDDGVGIEPELLGHVFDPFTQSERGLARTHGGLGLGLTLVKGLVELHGGSVSARSDGPGRGASFTVSLPLAECGTTADAPRPTAPAGLDLLVIEDSKDAADTLAELLRLAGHRVRVAGEGGAGLELARAAPPDVVVCDIGLPDMDGYAVARAIRADPALRGTRLVALSGYALPEDRARAAGAGFDAHLAKPAALAELEAVLASFAA